MLALGLLFGFANHLNATCQSVPEDIPRLIAELHDDEFSVRQRATYLLIKSGSDAIDHIESQLESLESDARARAISVLKILAVDDRSDVHRRARNSLVRLSEHPDPVVAIATKRALRLLELVEQSRWTERFHLLGARTNAKVVSINGRQFRVPYDLNIGPDWHGNAHELSQIGNLRDLVSITCDGPAITDEIIKEISTIDNLQKLTIKRASITNSAIEHLSNLPNLESLEMFYCMIDMDSVPALKQIYSLTYLRIIGSKLPAEPDFILQLQDDLAADIDIRRGAFMGIHYRLGSTECRLTQVVSGSGAATGGLQSGDIIVAFNGKKISEPSELTKQLRLQDVGDIAEITIQRNQKTLEKKVVFGEWE